MLKNKDNYNIGMKLSKVTKLMRAELRFKPKTHSQQCNAFHYYFLSYNITKAKGNEMNDLFMSILVLGTKLVPDKSWITLYRKERWVCGGGEQ